jgi:hypothetical protein
MSMKLEQQVVSLELTKRLKELGVKQSAHFYHVTFIDEMGDLRDEIYTNDDMEREYAATWKEQTAAYTVAELGEMLPTWIDLPHGRDNANLRCHKYESGWCMFYQIGAAEPDYLQESLSEADARAKMLIYLIENKLMNPKNPH